MHNSENQWWMGITGAYIDALGTRMDHVHIVDKLVKSFWWLVAIMVWLLL